MNRSINNKYIFIDIQLIRHYHQNMTDNWCVKYNYNFMCNRLIKMICHQLLHLK